MKKVHAKPVKLGPWVAGYQNIYEPPLAPENTLVEADNILIETEGAISPRKGYTPVSTNVHSLFRYEGRSYGIFNNTVCELFSGSAKQLSDFDVIGKVTWGVLNGDPVFTNSSVLARITNDKVIRIGVELPVVDISVGPISSTSVAVSFVNSEGEEGPLSPLFSGGAVQDPVDSTVASMRIYTTQATAVETDGEVQTYAGDVLYLVSEVAPGSASISADTYVGAPIGRPADTINKGRMPGGTYVRYWRGRLLVARGRTLFYSDPLRYGLYDQSAGFVTFESRIDFVESVDSGVFVGLRGNGVHFLAGDTPNQWQRVKSATESAQPGASMLVPAAQMKLELTAKPEWVAVWFTHRGFALGLPSGNVLYPQADLLSGLPLGNGSIHFDDDRLIVLSQ
jgi:hypothetical protein